MSDAKVVHVLSDMEYDVYVGRAVPRYGLPESPWANRYKVSDYGLEEALRCYEADIRYHIRPLITGVYMDTGVERSQEINFWWQQLKDLENKTLACWCAPKDAYLTAGDEVVCHGQILLRLLKEFSDSL